MSALVLRLREIARSEQRTRELLLMVALVVAAYAISRDLPHTYPLVFAGLAGAVGLMVMLRSPLTALVGLLFMSCIHYVIKAVIFHWHPSSIIFKDGLLVLLFAFWLLNVVIREGGLVRTPLNAPILAFAGVITLQAFNPNTYGAVAALDDFRFWIGPLVIYFLTIHLIRTRRDFDRALAVVFGYGLALAIYGCIQPSLPRELLVQLGADPNSYFYFFQGSVRAFSTMGTGQFALFAAMFAPLSFFYASQQREPLKRFIMAASAGAFVTGSILTLVRAGWVATAGALIAYAVLTRRWWILILLLCAGIVVGMLAQGYMRAKLEGLMNPGSDVSVQHRISVVRVMSEAVAFRVFGYGLGTFAHNRFAREMGYQEKTGYGAATENFFLMLVLELGWVGAAVFFWMLYKVYLLAWRQFRGLRTRRYRELSVALMASLIALEVARFAGPAGYYPPEAWHYWFFIGLIVLMPRFDAELEAELVPQA